VQQHDRLAHPRILPAPADTHLLLRAFVDELVRCGVVDAVTSPGSRSTPLVLALVRDGRLRCTSQIDERAGGFYALGLAKATRRPVVLACTSGTAAAEYLPAVVEAHEAGVPLLVLTADRPPELREVGAGQAIDQLAIYGRAPRWFFDVGTGHEATPERTRWMRSLACRAVWAAVGPRSGPVHLNWPLREPLVPPADLGEGPAPGRADGRPWLDRPEAIPASSAAALIAALAGAERPVVVAGRAERDAALPDAVVAFAAALGAPLLADPLSGARGGPAAIAHYDALLRVADFAAAHRPDAVVRVGDLPTSKPLRQWLAALPDATQVAFAPEGVWHDPDGVLSALLDGDPAATLSELGPLPAAVDGWLDAWRAADAGAARAINAALAGALTEPGVARELVRALPTAETLVVASSMPVRDVETFAPARDDGGPRVLANRGANGIDGTIATALGAALAGPTTVLTGDVALAYDASGLLAARRTGGELRIVVVDNDGGGIFEFLPVAGARDAFEEHVATPPGLDIPALAAALGLPYTEASTPDDLLASGLVHVRSDRRANVELHRRIWEDVAVTIRTK
jgi:2-succinyl-5-enolpyruvyl-6-hydroxy-3-cyclohexene-1-carboxylate synthase